MFFSFHHKRKKKSSLLTKERKGKQHIAIKKFNDELLKLVMIQDKMEKNYSNNEQQAAEMDKLYDAIWNFDEPIKNLEILLAKINFERNITEAEIEFKEATKEKISGLQAELECKQDLIMQEESEIFEIFSDLNSKRIDALDKLDFKREKLEKLGVARTEIDKVKELNNLGQLSWW